MTPLQLNEEDSALIRDLASQADGAKQGYATGWSDALRAMALKMAARKQDVKKPEEVKPDGTE